MNSAHKYTEKRYLVLSRDVITKFEPWMERIISGSNYDKILLVGNEAIDYKRVEMVGEDISKSLDLNSYSFSASPNGFTIGGNYFLLTNPYLIKIKPDTLTLEIIKYKEKIDIIRGEVVRTLEQEVIYP